MPGPKTQTMVAAPNPASKKDNSEQITDIGLKFKKLFSLTPDEGTAISDLVPEVQRGTWILTTVKQLCSLPLEENIKLNLSGLLVRSTVPHELSEWVMRLFDSKTDPALISFILKHAAESNHILFLMYSLSFDASCLQLLTEIKNLIEAQSQPATVELAELIKGKHNANTELHRNLSEAISVYNVEKVMSILRDKCVDVENLSDDMILSLVAFSKELGNITFEMLSSDKYKNRVKTLMTAEKAKSLFKIF